MISTSNSFIREGKCHRPWHTGGKLSSVNVAICRKAYLLGWEFQFLVPISRTPIVSGIPIPFLTPEIPVVIFFWNSNVWRVRKSEFRFAIFGIRVICLHRNSLRLIVSSLLRGLLYGTDLISVNSFCDVIFSLMRNLCYAQYINYNKNMSCKGTWWWSGSVYILVNGSVPMQIFYFSSSKMYELI